jgi:NAD(P)-dependent dehydrogenase (short-subunit alcohol dehydrogenase family)
MRATERRNSNEGAAATVRKQRAIQARVDLADRRKKGRSSKAKDGQAVQAGTRKHPANPLPKQHQTKPGSEAALTPPPQFRNPDYRGSGKLEDMAALITGADSGIGRGVAVLFAREGADVAIVYLNEHDDAEETRRVIEEEEGRRCLLIAGDVRDPAFCEDAVRTTVRDLGKLDILVNNAGYQQHARSLEELTEEQLDMTFRTNIYGYFHMAKAALPHLKNGSSIINTGSETGLFGQPVLLDYSATKGAIHAFTKALAINVIERGIRVNAVAPGPVWTPFNPSDKAAEDVPGFGQGTSMKRPAQPEELAPAYVFLASPVCASYITGLVLPVIGGAEGG